MKGEVKRKVLIPIRITKAEANALGRSVNSRINCGSNSHGGRARLSPSRRSRNQSGARTFLSAAMSNGSKALGRSDPVGYSGVAADKNVRAPVASRKSSRFAQTFAYSNPARRGAGNAETSGELARSRRAGDSAPYLPSRADGAGNSIALVFSWSSTTLPRETASSFVME